MLKTDKIKYMNDSEAKNALVEIGKRVYARGYVASNDGNISVKVSDSEIWVTPTGVSKGYMNSEMMVKMNLNGNVIYGQNKPSSEVKMHLRVYNENPNVTAVTHAHPPIATAFAVAGINLDKPIMTEAVLNLGSVPVASYGTPGTNEIPDSIASFCKSHSAVLLANHGVLTLGSDLFEAYYKLESVEQYATVMMYAINIIGKANVLSIEQVSRLEDIRENAKKI